MLLLMWPPNSGKKFPACHSRRVRDFSTAASARSGSASNSALYYCPRHPGGRRVCTSRFCIANVHALLLLAVHRTRPGLLVDIDPITMSTAVAPVRVIYIRPCRWIKRRVRVSVDRRPGAYVQSSSDTVTIGREL